MSLKPTDITLSKASGVPFYRQIQDQIAELVRAGRVLPGDKLPSVRELARQMVVSVITTRRAYLELESEGLIVRRQGRGTFVADDVAQQLQLRSDRTAQTTLTEAVDTARRLGLSDAAILEFVTSHLKGMSP